MSEDTVVERPAPQIGDRNRGFWEGAARGELTLQFCSSGHFRYPIASICPRCWSSDWEWRPVSGRGRILSFVTYHRAYHPAFAAEVPYNVALVRLAEGPALVSNIVRADQSDIVCDAPVEVVFTEMPGGYTMPQFILTEPEVTT